MAKTKKKTVLSSTSTTVKTFKINEEIKKEFLALTNHTYPDGHEKEIYHMLPEGVQEDEFGNKFIKIGEKTNSMFTSHLDTATSYYGKVVHVCEDDMIKSDGKSILGADDKAGVVIMNHMIRNKIPGLYYFFLAEEVGCKGSKKLAEKWKADKTLYEGINKVVAFDRKAYKSIITHQYGRTCSDEFAKDLAKKLNDLNDTFVFESDPTGLYTDSAQFKSMIPECTNISVGYFDQHTFQEKQNIEFLSKLCDAVLEIKWEELLVKRNPETDNDYGTRSTTTTYNRTSYGYDGHDSDYTRTNYGSNSSYNRTGTNSFSSSKISEEVKFWYDDKYDELSEFKYKSGKLSGVNLSPDRIIFEERVIKELLHVIDIPFDTITWDGNILQIRSEFKKDGLSEITRNEIIEFLPEFDYVAIAEKLIVE